MSLFNNTVTWNCTTDLRLCNIQNIRLFGHLCRSHLYHMSNHYLLTPWYRALLEKLTGLQLVKKFPAFHGTRRFITALTSVRHLSLSWASPIQSRYPHSTSWRSILILSAHLRLGLPSGLLPSGFPTKTLYTPLSPPIRAQMTNHNYQNSLESLNTLLSN